MSTPGPDGDEWHRDDVAAARRAYRGAPIGTRLHVAARSATCPLDRLERLVPGEGRVLDVGCGHGLVSILLALRAPTRVVTGVDIDVHKLEAAERAAARAGVSDRVRFEQVAPDWLPERGSADAVVIVDVLYLVPPDHRARLLGAAVDAVAGGGTLVVKEMADRPRWKRRLTAAQERVSVGVAGITQGETVALPSEAELVAPLLGAGARVRTVDLGRGRPHPHLAVVARIGDRGYARGRPGAGSGPEVGR